MSKYASGDKVVVNGNLVATIQSYDKDNDRLVFVTQPAGGGTETVYGHISQTRLEHLVAPTVAADEKPSKSNGKHESAAE